MIQVMATRRGSVGEGEAVDEEWSVHAFLPLSLCKREHSKVMHCKGIYAYIYIFTCMYILIYASNSRTVILSYRGEKQDLGVRLNGVYGSHKIAGPFLGVSRMKDSDAWV